VFAFWAVRLDALTRKPTEMNLAEVFQRSRDHGLEPGNLAIIAREWSPKLGLSEPEITSYLTQNIDYYLDRKNHAGLTLFLQYCQEIGLIESIPDLRFLGAVAFGIARK
jgi:predicted solute-binding protein